MDRTRPRTTPTPATTPTSAQVKHPSIDYAKTRGLCRVTLRCHHSRPVRSPGERSTAEAALRRVQPEADHQREIASIESSLQGRQPSWGEVFARKWRAPLVLGLGLAVLQQFTGINGVIYYADKIFAAADFNTPQSQTAATTWSIGAVNVLFTFVAVGYVDRFGRRPLLLAGLVGMGISLLVISLCFFRLGRITVHGSASGNTPSDAASSCWSR